MTRLLKKGPVTLCGLALAMLILAACGESPTAAPAASTAQLGNDVPTVATAAQGSATSAAAASATTAPAMTATQPTAAPTKAAATATQGPKMSDLPVIKTAPDFTNTTWLNTPNNAPITLASLRGQVVAVDFWTFECINCIHMLPSLKKLYSDYADKGLTIVSFHDPEFEAERDWNNVQKAVADDGVKYAVAQDNDFATWNKYGVHAWPTVFLVDKQGRIRYSHIGEWPHEEIDGVVKQLLAEPNP